MVRSGRNYGPVTLGRDLPMKKEAPKHNLGGCPLIVECPFFWMLWGRFYVSVLCVCPSSPPPPLETGTVHMCVPTRINLSHPYSPCFPLLASPRKEKRKKAKIASIIHRPKPKKWKRGRGNFFDVPGYFSSSSPSDIGTVQYLPPPARRRLLLEGGKE